MDGENWQHCPLQWFVPLGLPDPWGSFSAFNQVQGTLSQQQGLPACTKGHAGRASCWSLMTLKSLPGIC